MDIIADELPAEVSTADGALIRRARAIITAEGLTVYTEPSPGDEPVLAFRSRLTAVPTDLPDPRAPRRRRTYKLQTEDGAVTVNAVSGCLCVFPTLRAYTPDHLADLVHSGVITMGA